MKGKMKRNRKGAVLLTVLCFATVCMIVATMALRVSTYSSQESNTNVRRTQAQIIAENYLVEYINTFGGNYDKLSDLAGASEELPTKVTVTLRDSANQVVNTTDTAYGGQCTIYIYRSGSGVVVKSEATYAGRTEMASAYFDGSIVVPYESNNVIETNGTYDVTEASPAKGDIMIENADEKTITSFHNNNSNYEGNFYTNGNMYLGAGTTTQSFLDTIRDTAPTITAKGNIYINNLIMKTEVGKTDVNGNTRTHTYTPGTTYDPTKLLNRNGYINCDGKIIITNAHPQIGDSTNDIDIYCRGAFIGGVPATYGNGIDNTSFKNDIDTNYGGSNTNDIGTINHGNFYCLRGSGSTQDGNFVLNALNTNTIYGDLIVDGDIYIMQSSATLKVTGKIYCTGTIYDNNMNPRGSGSFRSGCINTTGVESSLPISDNVNTVTGVAHADPRSSKPSMDYAPGLYVYDSKETPTVSKPSSYVDASPNDMYADGYAGNPDTRLAMAAKYIQDKFHTALTTDLKDASDYNGTDLNSLSNGNGITITKSCKLTINEAEKEQGKITVKPTNEDIVILLPVTNKYGKINSQFRVDNSAKTGDYFVYFMFYDPANYVVGSTTGEYSNNYYTNESRATGCTFHIHGYNLHSTMIGTTTFSNGFNSLSINENEVNTNIMFLLPDGFNFKLGGDGMQKYVQAVIYGPNATYEYTENVGSRVYGQLKVKDYITNGVNQNEQIVRNCPPANDSILGYIAAKQPTDNALKFEYFIRHK